MAGNVSEWVASSYDASSYEYSTSFNPNVNDKDNPRKVVRGGSWKDVAYYFKSARGTMNMLILHEVL